MPRLSWITELRHSYLCGTISCENKALDSLAEEGQEGLRAYGSHRRPVPPRHAHGFKSLAETTSERNIIVWLNEYFGIIERDGKRFGEMTAFLENEAKVFGSVRLIRQEPGHIRTRSGRRDRVEAHPG